MFEIYVKRINFQKYKGDFLSIYLLKLFYLYQNYFNLILPKIFL